MKYHHCLCGYAVCKLNLNKYYAAALLHLNNPVVYLLFHLVALSSLKRDHKPIRTTSSQDIMADSPKTFSSDEKKIVEDRAATTCVKAKTSIVIENTKRGHICREEKKEIRSPMEFV